MHAWLELGPSAKDYGPTAGAEAVRRWTRLDGVSLSAWRVWIIMPCLVLRLLAEAWLVGSGWGSDWRCGSLSSLLGA
ncbi:uncharacterized protein K452DRAFT_42786 [Aplosporella prunicola CBS 121167]|uniref:Uncharacterized protein n=1 Tax=Aplosporella prunicola CBS 121167 TaxID=1176127 RepID=A0A6A6BEL0_9PEZI|nr:uncharacterized protein K452DRAFT_42786 [Aplosporella prunicola CBS 121167]KAF2140911.1 hypothetical protein K452DRAFT_42786 [Aplosporella prunicola CBS 121167]